MMNEFRRGNYFMEVVIIVPVVLVASAVIFHIYIFNFHRVQTYQDFMTISMISRMPSWENDEKSCKRLNATHFICLPNVFFIGASKSGTTSMTDYLIQHPRIKFIRRRISPKDKHREVHRFDRNSYNWALKWIELGDEWASSPPITDKSTVIIHYTPHYLYAPSVPFELRQFHPKPDKLKFIIMLRNPIDRAWSSYWFQHSHLFNAAGNDTGSFEEFEKLALREIIRRPLFEECMSKELLTLGHGATTTAYNAPYDIANSSSITNTTPTVSRHNYFQTLQTCFGPNNFRSSKLGGRHIDKGIYIDQITRWTLNFPSPPSLDNFHFIFYEHWKENPREEMNKLLMFLAPNDDIKDRLLFAEEGSGISYVSKRLVKPNKISRSMNMSTSLRSKLQEFYNPYNELLDKFLNVQTGYNEIH